MTFDESTTILRRMYGDDVVQEASLWTLTQQPRHPPSRLWFLAKRLARAGYRDTQMSKAHQHTWGREAVSPGRDAGITATATLWMRPTSTPEDLALLREAIRRLPPWLVRWSVDEGFVYRRPCQRHAMRWWYPSVHRTDRRVRCRRCDAEG